MPEYASLVYCNFTRDTAGNWLDVGHCTDFLSDCKFFVGHQEEFSEVRGHKVKDSCVTNCSGVFLDEVNWSCTNTSGKSILSNSSNRLSHTSLYTKLDRNKPARVQMGNKEAQFHKRKARKSNSVPPFYKRRRKFFDLNNLFKIEAGQINSDDTTCPEINNPKHKLQAFDQCHLHSKKKCVDDPLCIPRLENEAFLKRGFHLTVHVVFSSLLAADIFGWSEYSCIMYTFMKHSKTDDYSCCLESIFIAFGCANGYSSPAESGIIYDLSLSTAEYSFFGSLVFFGSMLGAIISGKVADFIGRKGALWLNSLFYIIGWLAIVFAEGIWSLDFGRLLVGFSCGVQSYVSVVYVAEIIPKSIRGGFTMANQLIVSGGIAVMFSVGNIISWRNLALIGTVACIIQFIGLLFIPESPRWLSKVGRYKDAESTLQWLRGEGTDISREATEIQDSSQSLKEKLVPTFKEFLRKRYARLLIVGVGLPFLLPWVGANGVLLYASSICKAAGCGAGLATTTMAFIQIPFAVLGVLFMDKFGRRPLLIVQLAGVCLGSILIGLGFLLQDMQLWTNITPRIVLFGIPIYFSLYSFGAGLPFVIISEIFPMNLKSTAGSLAVFVLSLNSWIVSYAFNFMFEWNSAGTFFIFSIICVLLIAFVVKMLPETKGRSLEEIEASWLQEDVY